MMARLLANITAISVSVSSEEAFAGIAPCTGSRVSLSNKDLREDASRSDGPAQNDGKAVFHAQERRFDPAVRDHCKNDGDDETQYLGSQQLPSPAGMQKRKRDQDRGQVQQ